MSRKTLPVYLKCLFLLVCLCSSRMLLRAQSVDNAGLTGVVQDTSDARIPDADVKLVNTDTGAERDSKTNHEGNFSFPAALPGHYTLRIERQGFDTTELTGVTLDVGVNRSVVIRMKVGVNAETVSVSAGAETLDTTSTTQTTTIPTKAVLDTPIAGRDFTQLVSLTPGYAGGSLNGTRSDQIDWKIDGSDNNDPWWNSVAVNQTGVTSVAGVLLPLDAIDQVSIVTQGSTEFGKNSGGNVNVVTKSGTNNIHGSAYYFNYNEAFAVDSPFTTPGTPKQERRNQHFGFSLGGPILKNKLFYFLTGEKQQFRFAGDTFTTEPSIAYQTAATQLISTYNAAYGGYAINPVSKNLLSTLWPSNALNGPASAENYFSTGATTGYSYNSLIKLDYAITPKHLLSVRYFNGQGTQTAPEGSYLDYYFRVGPFKVQNYTAFLNSTLSDHVQNEILAGVNWFNYSFGDANHSFNPISLGLNTEVDQTALSGSPYISISGFDELSGNEPSGRNSIVGHLTDTLSYVVGRHVIKVGGEFRQSQLDEFYRNQQRGEFYFDGTQGPWTTNPIAGANPDDPNVLSLADFMLGYYEYADIARGNPERQVHINSFNLFAQDSWQVSRKLNINFGLRYDYFGPFHNGDKNLVTFLPSTGGFGIQGNGLSSVYPADWNNLAPRLGFSYQPSGKAGLVFRGAFGIYYDQPNLALFFDNYVGNGGASGLQQNPFGPNPVSTITVNGCSIYDDSGSTVGHSSTCTIPSNGTPVFPATGTLGNSLFAASQNFRTPYTLNFSFNMEKSLGPNVIWQIGYVGSQSRKLLALLDINQAAPLSNGANSTRPLPQYGPINSMGTIANANYNSLQTSLKTSSWHGLVGRVSYTWAHALDEASSDTFTNPANSNDFKAQYGNGDNDLRHSLTGYVVYALPEFSKGPKALTNGWEVSAIVSAHTGWPFSAWDSRDTSGVGEYSDRVNQIGDPYAGVSHKLVDHSYVQWLNPSAFARATSGTFGTSRRNQFRGPGYGDMDLGVMKNTHVTERVNAQLRAEVFNVTNRLNLSTPSATFGYGSFGQITSTNGGWIGSGNPFNMQLGLKIIF